MPTRRQVSLGVEAVVGPLVLACVYVCVCVCVCICECVCV